MACGLYKMIMIQKPQRIQPGDSGFGFLLPINPPKIDTLLLHGVKQDGKVFCTDTIAVYCRFFAGVSGEI